MIESIWRVLAILGIITVFAPPAMHPQKTKSVDPMHTAQVQVPFVGCASDGQAGPIDPPRGRVHPVTLPARIAQRLAWYQAQDGPGILAPRAWHCFETYGSSGGSLFVSPDPIDHNELFSDNWKGFKGPAIQISVSVGGTSGRFEVASIIARVFPRHMAFLRDVISDGIEPASAFPADAPIPARPPAFPSSPFR